VATSRETVRDALVTLLDAALSGTVKTVTGSKVGDMAGKTPLVAVLSSGVSRERMTFLGTIPTFYLEIQTWVRQATTDWTNAQAEDALDTIESLIAGVIEDNVETDDWTSLEYAGQSVVMDLIGGGISYYMERIPLRVNMAKA